MKHYYSFSIWLIPLFFALNLQAQQVTFSKDRGFYTTAFNLTLSTDLSGATIKYTTNGTPPSSSVGATYASAIAINTTTVIRAIAINGTTTSKVFTYTYIFPNKVGLQPAIIAGWPNKFYALGDGSDTSLHDYEMDPDIVNNTAYSGQIQNALTAIPTMSIVMDKDSFWLVNDDLTGDLEQPASVELLYPDAPIQNEQINCGLEAHSHLRLKRSFSLDFHAPEFISKIFKYAPLNSATATDDFSGTKIVLRGGNNDCWARNWNASGTTYTRDEWYRSSQLAVNGYGSRGTFVHLYINGIYWGLYNPVERPDEGFTSEYLGGSTADWLSVNHDGIRSGDPTRYNYLIGALIDKDISNSTNYNELKQYLDVSAFSDYMIVSWMNGMDDWPNNNYYGANRNIPTQPFLYFGWDAEWSWTNKHGSNNGAWVSPYFESNQSRGPIIAEIWHAARDNSDFMMLFADRVYKNCFNDGAMTDVASRDRWATINDFINTAIIAESARWGDAEDPAYPRTKNSDWQPEVNRIDALMNGNVTRFINALKAQGYYPTIDPPAFNQETGTVVSGFQLAITNPNGAGTIYYTTNGTDPRLPGGAISPAAIIYSSAITINSPIAINARVYNGTKWSALHLGSYGIYNLKINELLASNVNGITDEFGDHNDWIEIYNNSAFAVNVAGLYITDAFTSPNKWQIPASNANTTTIPPYGYKLFWADGETTEGILHANFTMSTSGDKLAIVAKNGSANVFLDSLTFGAQTADISRGRLPDGTGAFQSFSSPTPGYSNQPPITGLFINEFLASNQTGIVDEFNQFDDWFEIYNNNNTPVDIGGLYLTDNLTLPLKYQIPKSNPTVTTIPAKGFLLLWADEETTQGLLHVGFKLGNSGEQLGLAQLGAMASFIDSLSFGAQTTNVSRGRLPNGGSSFDFFPAPTPAASNGSTVDCNGVLNGTAVIDDCGVCAGGNTGIIQNANKDCNGVCNGTAAIDGCGVCAGGNTGKTPNSNKDACGVCFGNGSSCSSTCVHNQVVSFTLMKEGTAGEIGPLTSGMTINKATIGKFSIRANVCNTPVGSVKFILNGSTFKTETAFPYALNGDSPVGSYIAWNPNTGSYTLKATPYSGSSGSGTAGVSLTVTFTVVNQSSTVDCNGVTGGTAAIDACGVCAGGNTGKVPNADKDCNGVCFGSAAIDNCGVCAGGNTGKTPNANKDACGVCFGNGSTCATCVHNEVVSFTLMKAGTAGEIGPLTSGMVISKSAVGQFSIRANVCNTSVGSVKFILNGSTFKTETTPPYALNGDNPIGSYIAWNASARSYTLKATPYSGANATGTAGISKTVTFTVVNSSSKTDGIEVTTDNPLEFNIYPNPNNGSFAVEGHNDKIADLILIIYNPLGQIVYQTSEKQITGNYIKQVALNNLVSGIYYAEMKWGEEIKRERIILE